MKLGLLALGLILTSTMSFAQSKSIAGKYSLKKELFVYAQDKQACVEDWRGKWDKVQDICVVKAEDTVIVKQSKRGYSIEVETFGNNLHTCQLTARATLKNNILTSRVASEEGECEVTASFKGNKVSVENNGQCQMFCGANGWLDTVATKVK